MSSENASPARWPTRDNPFGEACRILDESIAARAFPGCAFGVIAGEFMYKGARGRFTYEPDSPAVAADTVYDLASVTKVAATTAVAMLLHQRGRLDIDIPLGDLVPEFLARRTVDDPARRVRLRHLLAHNSGLPGYVEFFSTVTTPADLFQACLELPLQAEPGMRAEYSDPGFILLGRALENIVEEPLSAWAHREVFEPLAMAATGFSPAPPVRPSIPPTEEDATFRQCRIQGEVQDENAWILGGVAGHAGLFSNVPDLLRFSTEVLQAVRGTGPRSNEANLFRPQTVEFFGARQVPEDSSRALGWDTPSPNSSSGRFFSPHSIGHLGYSGCSLWIDLDAGVAVVLLTNRTWPNRQSQLIREVRPAFHNAIREALM